MEAEGKGGRWALDVWTLAQGRPSRHLRYRELPPSPTTGSLGRQGRSRLIVKFNLFDLPHDPRDVRIHALQRASVDTSTVVATVDAVWSGERKPNVDHVHDDIPGVRFAGHCPLRMYLIPDEDNMFVWKACSSYTKVRQSPALTIIRRNWRTLLFHFPRRAVVPRYAYSDHPISYFQKTTQTSHHKPNPR